MNEYHGIPASNVVTIRLEGTRFNGRSDLWCRRHFISHFYHLPRARLAFARFNLTPASIAHADRFVARDFYFGLLREVIAYPSYYIRPYEQ